MDSFAPDVADVPGGTDVADADDEPDAESADLVARDDVSDILEPSDAPDTLPSNDPETPDVPLVEEEVAVEDAAVDDTAAPEDTSGPFVGPDGSWEARAPFPVSRDRAAATSANGFLFVAGGFTPGGQPAKEMHAYSVSGNSWSAGDAMPTGRAAPAHGLVTGRLYVAGGDDGTGLDHVLTERYNIGGESWLGPALPSMPEPHCCGASASDGSRLYVAGGRGGSASLRSYAPAEGIWRDHAPLPEGRAFGVAAFVSGRLVVGLGANGASLALASMTAWSPESDSWEDLAPAPAPRIAAAAVARGDRVFVAGGLDATGAPSNTVWLFDLALGWVDAPPLAVSRAFHSLLATAEGLWVVGGQGPAAHLTTLEHLPLAPL